MHTDTSISPTQEYVKLDSSRSLVREGTRADAQVYTGGLSTPHISPQPPKNSPKSPKFRSAGVVGWSQGALFQATRSGESQPQVGGGERSQVGGFTREARLRALRMLAQTDRGAPNCFYTLTYSDAYVNQVCVDEAGAQDAGRKVKRDLDAWGKRICRTFPQVGLFWRVETIDRKSGQFVGKVFPHVHGFLWGVTELDQFRSWLNHSWAEIAAAGSQVDPLHVQAGTQVQQPNDWRAVMAYASKMVYATKPGDSQLEGLGRWWGAINREVIPWSPIEAFDPGDKAAVMMVRTMRRYLGRVTHLDGTWLRKARSLTIFTDSPDKWAALAAYFQGYYSPEKQVSAEDFAQSG